ncbi:hypothetical protein AAG906_031426 [Vitis piasezkii]
MDAEFMLQPQACMWCFVLFLCVPEPQIYHKKQKPAWLDSFLRTDFLGACLIHEGRKSELNVYCINCDAGMCESCHVHKDVVLLADMQKHIDCSQIQPYRCNGKKVLAVNPLPHSGRELNSGEMCKVCHRIIFKPSIYTYCSISCKVAAVSTNLTSSDPPYLAPKKPKKKPPPKPSVNKTQSPPKRVNKRKGVPSRAPFF